MQEPPDGLTKGIRFGCGALFGAVAGAGALFTLILDGWYWVAVVAAVSTLVCGFLAMRWGEDFWSWVVEHRWWFWG